MTKMLTVTESHKPAWAKAWLTAPALKRARQSGQSLELDVGTHGLPWAPDPADRLLVTETTQDGNNFISTTKHWRKG